MAMPPTRLAALVSEDGRRTAESLKREGCLSPNGLSRLDDVARIVEATWTRFHASERSRMLGPTVTYDVVAALSGLGYLSEKAAALHRQRDVGSEPPPPKPWWKFW